jgi:hypothetical protein
MLEFKNMQPKHLELILYGKDFLLIGNLKLKELCKFGKKLYNNIEKKSKNLRLYLLKIIK